MSDNSSQHVNIGPRIVCAAMRDDAGFILTGARHFDGIMHAALRKLPDYDGDWEQGFINQRGEFLNRKDAWLIASNAGQIIRRVGGDDGTLYSENLY